MFTSLDLFFSVSDKREAECCPQSVSDSPAYSIRAAGVLRYSRESDSHWTDVTTIPPTVLTSHFYFTVVYSHLNHNDFMCVVFPVNHSFVQLLTEYPMKCEYCGEDAKPSLDLTWIQLSEVRRKVHISRQTLHILFALPTFLHPLLCSP